jgi:hypothetical protein
MGLCEDLSARKKEKMSLWQEDQMWRWALTQSEHIWSWEDLKIRRCEGEVVKRWADMKNDKLLKQENLECK